MARTPLLIGNWKMNLDTADARALATAIRAGVEDAPTVECIVCPSFPALAVVRDVLAGSRVGVGAQNAHGAERGSYTGEVSSRMLRDCATHVILGHSERRLHSQETDADVNRKAQTALAAGLIPIICVGEDESQNQAGETRAVVSRQVTAALAQIEAQAAARLIVAYEPVWAIGTGKAAMPAWANEVCGEVIRALLADLYDARVAETVRILYGGSTNASNIESYMAQTDIDGALIGGASLSSAEYGAMVAAVARQAG